MYFTQEELFAALGLLMERIEACPASTEATDAVVLAGDIRSAIGNEFNPPDNYAAMRVLDLVQPNVDISGMEN